MKRAPIWIVVVLLGATLCLTELRGDTDRVPYSRPLEELPTEIAGLHSKDIPISPEALAVLGKGFFLNRVYQSESEPGATPAIPVGLFIGYFPTQRSGQSIHSPQNCLPGSGWSFESSGVTEWSDASGKYRVGEYLISNGSDRQEVLYWYRSHGRNIANDYVAKARMITDSILYHRTDAALVRITTPLVRGESQADAHNRAIHFTKMVTPLLSAYVPD